MTIENRSSIIRRILRNKKAVTGISIFFIGYTLTFFAFTYGNNLNVLNSEDILRLAIKAIPIITAIIGIGYFLFGYLEGYKSIETKKGTSDLNFQNTDEIKLEFRRYFEELRHNQERNRYENQELIELLKNQFEQQKELHLDEKQG